MVARPRRPVVAGCVGGRVSVASRSASKSIPKCHNPADLPSVSTETARETPSVTRLPADPRSISTARTPPGRRRQPTDRSTDLPLDQPLDRSTSRPTDRPTARPTDQRPTDQRPTDQRPTAGRRGLHCDFAAAHCHIVTASTDQPTSRPATSRPATSRPADQPTSRPADQPTSHQPTSRPRAAADPSAPSMYPVSRIIF